VPSGSAIPKVAEEVVSEIEPTVTGVVSETVPNGMTASSPGPGTVPVFQSAGVFQLSVPSIQVFVVILPIPFAYMADFNEARVRVEGERRRGAGGSLGQRLLRWARNDRLGEGNEKPGRRR
jgi:hypothetical protein